MDLRILKNDPSLQLYARDLQLRMDNYSEFSRILKDTGRLYTVVPGCHHLYGLKQQLYETPYLNDEKLPETNALKLQSKTKISADIVLSSQEDIDAVFRMTPYYFHTSIQDKEKLKHMGALETKIEFVIGEYRK